MKNLIVLAICMFFAVPMYCQTNDSLVNDKVQAVKVCSADLLADMDSKHTQEKYPKAFKNIMNRLDRSNHFIKKIDKKNFYSKNNRYASKAIKHYNAGRSIYNKIYL